MPIYHGTATDAPSGRYAIVVSRYNDSITSNLLAGAVETLKQAGVPDTEIDVAWVPGAFEIPLGADQLAGSGRYVAVLCLGAVIRGDTTHDQHINRAVSLGIMEANLRHNVPVLFGVLTCDTVEQAIQRSGSPVAKKKPTGDANTKSHVGNKGVECAQAALEMVSLLRKVNER